MLINYVILLVAEQKVNNIKFCRKFEDYQTPSTKFNMNMKFRYEGTITGQIGIKLYFTGTISRGTIGDRMWGGGGGRVSIIYYAHNRIVNLD